MNAPTTTEKPKRPVTMSVLNPEQRVMALMQSGREPITIRKANGYDMAGQPKFSTFTRMLGSLRPQRRAMLHALRTMKRDESFMKRRRNASAWKEAA